MRNTRKSPCRRWLIGKRIGRRIHNAACNRNCCRWNFECRWLPLCSRMNRLDENVLGILDGQYDCIRQEALALVDDDVVLKPMKFKASDFGAPTSRERAFFIGYRAGAVAPISESDFAALKVKRAVTVARALRGLPPRIYSRSVPGSGALPDARTNSVPVV
jgi:site-specific DNA-cytosine methylase